MTELEFLKARPGDKVRVIRTITEYTYHFKLDDILTINSTNSYGDTRGIFFKPCPKGIQRGRNHSIYNHCTEEECGMWTSYPNFELLYVPTAEELATAGDLSNPPDLIDLFKQGEI